MTSKPRVAVKMFSAALLLVSPFTVAVSAQGIPLVYEVENTGTVTLTHHDRTDFLVSFRITPDGTFVLVWEQRDSDEQRTLMSLSSDVWA